PSAGKRCGTIKAAKTGSSWPGNISSRLPPPPGMPKSRNGLPAIEKDGSWRMKSFARPKVNSNKRPEKSFAIKMRFSPASEEEAPTGNTRSFQGGSSSVTLLTILARPINESLEKSDHYLDSHREGRLPRLKILQ